MVLAPLSKDKLNDSSKNSDISSQDYDYDYDNEISQNKFKSQEIFDVIYQEETQSEEHQVSRNISLFSYKLPKINFNEVKLNKIDDITSIKMKEISFDQNLPNKTKTSSILENKAIILSKSVINPTKFIREADYKQEKDKISNKSLEDLTSDASKSFKKNEFLE